MSRAAASIFCVDTFDAASRRTSDLLATYGAILTALRERGVIRTSNAPAGDYAEFLVAQALGGVLSSNSTKSYDLIDAVGRTIQVKCRLLPPKGNGRVAFSPFRSFDFDLAAMVILRQDYSVARAALVEVAAIQAAGVYRAHVNGHIVHADDLVFAHTSAEDITERLRKVAIAL